MKFATFKELLAYADRKNMNKTSGMNGGPTGPVGIIEAYDASGKGDNGPTGFGKEAVGDLASDVKGTGARFNAGKDAVELIPVWVIYEAALQRPEYLDTYEQREAMYLLERLSKWQMGAISAIEMFRAFDGEWTTDCAAVFDYGRKKYAEWNWAKGMKWSVPTGCAVRHLLAILRGEANDVGEKEAVSPHRGHVSCNLVMLAQYEKNFTEGDDRPKWIRTCVPNEGTGTELLLEKNASISKPVFSATGYSSSDVVVGDFLPPGNIG